MSLLIELATNTGSKFPTYFVAVYVVGFIAAVSIGSIAWYNSKRPAGWENVERPDFVPDVDVKKEAEDSSSQK